MENLAEEPVLRLVPSESLGEDALHAASEALEKRMMLELGVEALFAQVTTTRHVRLDCPYAMVVVDALARAVSVAEGQPPAMRRATAAAFLREVGAAMVTGHRASGRAASGPFAVIVTELTRVLMERQQRNAAGGPLDCDARVAVSRA